MNAPMMPPQGQPIPQMPGLMPPIATPQPPPKPITHDVTVVSTKKLAQVRVLGVPPEEVGIERAARSIRDCNYFFHEVVTKTQAQLIAEGFNKEQIKSLPAYTGLNEIETIARDTEWEHMDAQSGGGGLNKAASPVKITEHYVRMDYEGSGRPCLYQVITGGDDGEILRRDKKLAITPFDAIPFASWTPVPQSHRFFGRSIADLVMPAQREKTALKRGALDNLYLHNNPRVEVAEANAGPNTLDDLLVSRPAGIVRTKTPGGINWQTVPDITGSIYPMVQYIDAEIEARTGLTKQGQGIDANALQNQSATAVAQVFSASQMRLKLIARHLAEGVKDICGLLHATIRKHGQEQQTVQLRGQWATVDPRGWKTRNDMTIHVGLGNGSKAQQFAQIMAIGQVQDKMLQGGKANLVDDGKLYNTASELAKIMGHKSPDRFFNDPEAKDPQTGQLLHPPVPAPPDPKVQAVQAKAQADIQTAQIKAKQDQDKAQLDALHQKIKLESEAQLAREKADLDAKLALVEAQLKERADLRAHELHQQKMAHAQQLHEHTLQQKSHDTNLKVAQAKGEAKAKGIPLEVPQEEQAKEDKQAKMIEALHETVGHLGTAVNHVGHAIKELSRPKRIVRDPKTGRAVGTESA